LIRFVVDASIILTWCFPDEETQKAEETSERIALGARVVVPAFWPHEILNALLVGEKRKRLTPELTQAFIADLSRLPVDLDVATGSNVVFNDIQSLCRKHRLTAYDAAYLEIAVREKIVLATVDADLKRAALDEGVQLL
jgi:predicted nucleic acid-binding protein